MACRPAMLTRVTGRAAAQKLRTGMADCLTLDLRRITGKGIVSGSSFRPPPLAELSHRFGSAPRGDSAADAQAGAQAEALEALAAALGAAEAAAERQAAARAVRARSRVGFLDQVVMPWPRWATPRPPPSAAAARAVRA